MSENTAVLSGRELSIRRYFAMWTMRDCAGIEDVFARDVIYIESDGKEYHGTEQLLHLRRLQFTHWVYPFPCFVILYHFSVLKSRAISHIYCQQTIFVTYTNFS